MRRDLLLIAGLATAGFLTALVASPDWLRAALLIPLVLFLPGYALAACLFAAGTITVAERCVYAVVLSISITAVGGVVTQLVLGLGKDLWVVLLGVVTVGTAAYGLITQPRVPTELNLILPRPLSLALVVLAAVLAVAAVTSANDGLHKAQGQVRFTSFWMLPASGGESAVMVGLNSHEGRRTDYVLELNSKGEQIASVKVALRAGETWERSFPLDTTPPGAPVRAELRRDGQPYRYLSLTPSP